MMSIVYWIGCANIYFLKARAVVRRRVTADDDNEEVVTEKSTALATAIAVNLVLLFLVIFNLLTAPPRKSPTYTSWLFILLSEAVPVCFLSCAICRLLVRKNHDWIKIATAVTLFIYFFLSHFGWNCRVFEFTGGAPLAWITPAMIFLILIGTSVRRVYFVFITLVVYNSCILGIELFAKHKPCIVSTEPQRNWGGWAILNVMVPSILMMITFTQHHHRIQVQKSKMKESIATITVIAKYVARMDLSSAENWLTNHEIEEASSRQLQEALLQIIRNLEEYRPFLPATVFKPSSSDEKHPSTSRDGSMCSSAFDNMETKSSERLGASPLTMGLKPKMKREYTRDFDIGSDDDDCDDASTGSLSTKRSDIQYHTHNRLRPNVKIGLRIGKVVLMGLQLRTVITMQSGGDVAKVESEIFASISERFVNLLFSVVTDYFGTIHKFNGLAAVVSWNAVKYQSSSPELAAKCAEQLRLEVRKLREDHPAFANVSLHIGIHQTRTFCGNIGTSLHKTFHLDDTCVEFLKALTMFNEQIGTEWLITKPIYDAISPHLFTARTAERILVKKLGTHDLHQVGQPMLIYEVLFANEQGSYENEWMYSLQELHSNNKANLYTVAHNNFLRGEYAQAQRLFKEIAEFEEKNSMSSKLTSHLISLCSVMAENKDINLQEKTMASQHHSGKAAIDLGGYYRVFGMPWQRFPSEPMGHDLPQQNLVSIPCAID